MICFRARVVELQDLCCRMSLVTYFFRQLVKCKQLLLLKESFILRGQRGVPIPVPSARVFCWIFLVIRAQCSPRT